MDKGDITSAVVARLVATQFPQWADLPIVGVALDGWDNTTFRLGDDWSVRLPSADAYVAQVDKEHRWLPVLAKHLSLRIPEPIAIGRPSHEFPRPWSIYRWIEGDPANAGRIASLVELASDLAGFLGELYAIEASGGPGPGPHNSFRGGSIDIWDPETRQSIEFLANKIDARAVTELWERALGSRWDRAPVWVHGDMAPSNMLVADGRLSAVVDFGCAGIGDPACDLVMAWTFFTDESRQEFRRRLRLDVPTWDRARGWALWKALITLAESERGGRDADAAAGAFGWRVGPRQVIDLVLADDEH